MHALRSHAFRVLEGSVGEDLPASVAFHHPDLVLLDLAGIPARSREGPDAALALVRTASLVPIVALATEPDAPTAAATLTAGADDYLTWPVHLGELISRIRAPCGASGAPGYPGGRAWSPGRGRSSSTLPAVLCRWRAER